MSENLDKIIDKYRMNDLSWKEYLGEFVNPCFAIGDKVIYYEMEWFIISISDQQYRLGRYNQFYNEEIIISQDDPYLKAGTEQD